MKKYGLYKIQQISIVVEFFEAHFVSRNGRNDEFCQSVQKTAMTFKYISNNNLPREYGRSNEVRPPLGK